MTEMSLSGKVALITGAGRGFGQAIGELFAAEGADLALNYLNSQAGCEQVAVQARAAGRRALVLQGDVRQESAIKDLVARCLEEFGRIDILVNNAGVMTVGEFAETDRADWDADIQTNIYGPLMLTREVLPHMIERRSGRIINLSSQLAINGAAEVAVYSGTKGFIRIWTQALAKEVGQFNINVNCIGPGAIPTDMSEHFTGTEEQRERSAARNPLRHLGVPHDVAECALFLATDASNFITGQMLVVNGGSIM
ncbi:MAG TPA: 3-oxoacyl-ACP reductase family protein [Nitrolancea sp.]|jgi:3-oxoacyl-[acyl-carrier protein] reductase|nr:3-oxoacyl-ACP reductase family protein [Nitrolancea sp.]